MSEEKIKCPKCGAEYDSNEKFCGACGCNIEGFGNDVNGTYEQKNLKQNAKSKLEYSKEPPIVSTLELLANIALFVFLPLFVSFKVLPSIKDIWTVGYAYQGEYYAYHEAIHKHIQQAFIANSFYIIGVIFAVIIFFGITNFLIIVSNYYLRKKIDKILHYIKNKED